MNNSEYQVRGTTICCRQQSIGQLSGYSIAGASKFSKYGFLLLALLFTFEYKTGQKLKGQLTIFLDVAMIWNYCIPKLFLNLKIIFPLAFSINKIIIPNVRISGDN